MKVINNLSFLEAPDFIQDQIARELCEDFDSGYNIEDYKDLRLELVEFDPSDIEILTYYLNEKIRDEGQPSDQYYDDHTEELITFPILIINNVCSEGRHRLDTAIRLKLNIRAYIV